MAQFVITLIPLASLPRSAVTVRLRLPLGAIVALLVKQAKPFGSGKQVNLACGEGATVTVAPAKDLPSPVTSSKNVIGESMPPFCPTFEIVMLKTQLLPT